MWELILKTDSDFVFKPNEEWLGVHMPDKDKILINLPAVTRKIRTVPAGAPEGTERKRPYGPRGEISRLTERELMGVIIDTQEHEAIHAAMEDDIEREIIILGNEIKQELNIAGKPGWDESGFRMFVKQSYHMLLHEWGVRLLQGQSKEKIIDDLFMYIKDREGRGASKVANVINKIIMSGNLEELATTGVKMQQWHDRMTHAVAEKFLESLLSVQAKTDSAVLNSISNLSFDPAYQLPDEVNRRLEWAQKPEEP
tara:strand:- start:1449 stop:2213 length:765 start_codon:yes stop_codon:yes gene_type:complete